jgi:hypothetical protein
MIDNDRMINAIVKGFAAAAAVCVMTGSLNAASGLLIVQKTTTGTGAPQTNQIQIESNRMRAESTGPRGEKQVVIFDGTRQVLMMIDNEKKSYTELTQAEAEKFGSQMSDAMAQMQKQMASLPPEQRAQMEAIMKGRMGGAGGPGAARKTQYRRAGTDKVGNWTCDKYEGYDGAEKTSEVCTVDPKALGLTAADFAVSKQLVAFFRKVIPQMADQMFTIGSVEEQGFSGVPVRQTFSVGGRQITSEISEVTRQTFPDASYAAPVGYQKTSFGGGRR